KPFACPLAPLPATAQLAPMRRSPPSSHTDPPLHTAPHIAKPPLIRAPASAPPLPRPCPSTPLGPAHAQIPIAKRAAPPNTCPFPRFRPFEVFGRRPSPVGKHSCRPASENLHITGSGRPVPTTTFRGGWHILKSAQHRSTRSIAMCFA